MKLVQIFSPISAFKPVNIQLADLGRLFLSIFFSARLRISSSKPDLKMSSSQ